MKYRSYSSFVIDELVATGIDMTNLYTLEVNLKDKLADIKRTIARQKKDSENAVRDALAQTEFVQERAFMVKEIHEQLR